MNKRDRERLARLLPEGKPRKVRIYDNMGETADRYCVVYTGNFRGRGYRCHYVSMGSAPYNPAGFCQHGEHTSIIDYPSYSHLGKKIAFDDLPPDCQDVVLRDYVDIWELPVTIKRPAIVEYPEGCSA